MNTTRHLVMIAALAGLSSLGVSGQIRGMPGMMPADMAHVPDFSTDRSHPLVRGGAPESWTASDLVVIPAGTTLTYTTAKAHTIVVDGTLTCAASANSTLTVTTLVVRTGTLRCEPSAGVTATIIIADSPIDTTFDPEQWGHGVIGLGGVVRLKGQPKTTFVRLADELTAGQTTLTLAGPVTGWQAGDTVVIPDTRQLDLEDLLTNPFRKRISQTEYQTIASVAGTTVTLSKPLAFAHRGAHEVDGSLVRAPHVGNLSRNLVVRSANPLGVRGHTMFAHRADVQVEYARLAGMGRTRADALDSTSFSDSHVVTKVGTNQIGRYALHAHHLIGPETPAPTGQYRFIGNAVEDGAKWCLAIHDAHFGVIQDNVLTNCVGAGAIFEVGLETGNQFVHNFIVNTPGSTTLLNEAQGAKGDIGVRGMAIWFPGSGTDNVIRDNVGADGNGVGSFAAPLGGPDDPISRCPKRPGDDARANGVVCRLSTQPLLSFIDNEFYGYVHGLQIWGVKAPGRVEGLTVWHVSRAGLELVAIETMTVDRLTVYGSLQPRSHYFSHAGVNGSDIADLVLTNLAISNATYGVYINGSGYANTTDGAATLEVNNCKIHSRLALTYERVDSKIPPPSLSAVMRDCLLTPNGASSELISHTLYHGDYMHATVSTRVQVFNHQQKIGDNFEVFVPEQAPDRPMPNTGTFVNTFNGTTYTHVKGIPEAGLTNAQSWAKYGVAYGGRVATCTDTRPGIRGLVCPSSGAPSPPRPTVSKAGR